MRVELRRDRSFTSPVTKIIDKIHLNTRVIPNKREQRRQAVSALYSLIALLHHRRFGFFLFAIPFENHFALGVEDDFDRIAVLEFAAQQPV